jgi:AcrR family transcriptional regulator
MAKKSQQRLEQKRNRILDTAKDVLIKYGKDTSMSDIAQALGMDTSGLYYYYKSIPEILDTILEDKYAHLRLTDQDFQVIKSPLGIIKKMMTMLLEFYFDNAEIIQIILSQICPLCADPDREADSIAINHFLQAYHEANAGLLVEIEAAQKRKELSAEFPPALILRTMRGFIFGMHASWRQDKGSREVIPVIVEKFFLVYS